MKKLKLVFAVSLCVASLLADRADAETLFFDDFEEDLGKWPPLPTLVIEEDPDRPGNHVLAIDTTNDSVNVDALFLEGYENLEDCAMRARFNIVGETANYAVAGLFVRAQSATEYMLIEPAANRQGVSGVLNIFERGAGWPIVADGQVELEMSKWYELSVTVQGSELTASIDGKVIAEYDNVIYPSGGFGIRQWASKALYDDVELYVGVSSMQVAARDKLAVTWGTLKN